MERLSAFTRRRRVLKQSPTCTTNGAQTRGGWVRQARLFRAFSRVHQCCAAPAGAVSYPVARLVLTGWVRRAQAPRPPSSPPCIVVWAHSMLVPFFASFPANSASAPGLLTSSICSSVPSVYGRPAAPRAFLAVHVVHHHLR